MAGAVYGVVAAIVGWTEDELTGGRARLKVVSATPLNVATHTNFVGDQFIITRATAPQIDVTVKNTGEDPVLLTKARITVVASAWLPQCIFTGAGPIPVSGRYAIPLPFLPGPDERTVGHPLHDEVPAGGVDRFKLYFGAPQLGEDDNLYALKVQLTTDDPGQTINVGQFILGVPVPVSRSGLILPESEYLLTEYPEPPTPSRVDSVWCFRHNLASVRRLLSGRGRRGPEIDSLSEVRLARGWSSLARAFPAAQAVGPLLRETDLLPGSLLAVFAASKAHDPQLEARTRTRAVRSLLDESEAALVAGGQSATVASIDAHEALSLRSSPRGRELAARAQSLEREASEEAEVLPPD